MTRFSTKRTLAMVVAITMILCLVPIVSMAASISNLSIDYDDVEDKYVVSGTTSEFSSGGQVTMLVIYADGELTDIPTELDENYIMYIDQKDPDGDGGSFSWEFTKRDTAEERSHMTVFAGGSDVDTVGYASYEMPEDLLAGPAVTFPETSYTVYVNDSIEIKFTDDSEWRAAITSITIGGTEVFSSSDTTKEGKIILPAQPVGTVGEVVITATGYNPVTVTGSASVELRPAGVVALGDYSTLGCFVEGTAAYDAVFTITDSSPEGWLENLVIDVVDSEGNDAGEVSVDEGTGTITFTNAVPDDKTLYALTFDAADDYAAVEDIEFYIISKAGAALSSVKAATYDADTDPNKYSITVPGDYTDDVSGLTVAYSVTVDGVDKDISTSRTFEVLRPEDDGDGAVDYTTVLVTATVGEATNNDKKEQPILVPEVGASTGIEVDVTLNFGTATAAAALATVTVDDEPAVQDSTYKALFKTAKLADGDHTAVVARPGYVTFTITFEIADGAIAPAEQDKLAVTMVAGDINNDSQISLTDFNLLKAMFGMKKASAQTWNDAIDFNADDQISLTDFNMLKVNFGKKFNK